jgi:hypothetical protein
MLRFIGSWRQKRLGPIAAFCLVLVSFTFGFPSKANATPTNDRTMALLAPAIQDLRQIEDIARELKQVYHNSAADLSEVGSQYKLVEDGFANFRLTIVHALELGQARPAGYEESLNSLNKSVNAFQQYAKTKLPTKGLPVQLIPLALRSVSELIERYQEKKAEQREALIDQVKSQLTLTPFNDL